ncbi:MULTISPECIES: gamma-glutamyltransferase family protein [unclassified Achromobacter]|uniref:gamma-glutamyltransferase family protein n=1 Tax=unclassified Achromobacter TaxID=2626865 RepID=UPI000B5160E7|nr:MULTISPECIES: gamma-glutamyltransferase family protein [unclassified Achromobacter]OWT73376.1 gamma-glutamyltransferase [Achromobacter sp. HZ34]OWT79707.1 gamma-glutamyltransferase [Achromobacter sp. HZ28]
MTFDWHNPYRTTRAPVFARNVVATSQPLAAQAGLRILERGGNAVDAAIAAAAVLTLAEPVSNGLGSDCFAIIWDGARLHGMNASGRAPSAWCVDYFKRKHNGAIPMRGWDSVTVPGCVAGWAAMHEKMGALAFADVLAPAIEYAERGCAVSPIVQQKWAAQADVLQPLPGFAEHFLPRGRPPAVGEHFVIKGAADTLKRIAASSGRDFYEGETAHKLVAHAQAHDAAMTLADLREYQPEWVTPLAQAYRGYALHQIPPNGQGIAALIALGILQHFDVAARPVDHPDTQHLLIEAMKLAFADVYAHVGDSAHMALTADTLLDPAYLAERARLIDMGRAQDFGSGHAPRGGTVYLTAADRNGMMVSFIQSNYMGFGSGVVVPGTGVSLQNRGHGFSMQPDHPNVVAGGKRPFHTIIPGFLMRDGAPVMSFGVMGGNMQPQGHLQTLVRMLDYGQQPQAACDAPRWKWNNGRSVDVEPAMPHAVQEALRARGHVLEGLDDPYMDFGSGQFIWRLGDPAVDGYVAASDSRRDGLAAGF